MLLTCSLTALVALVQAAVLQIPRQPDAAVVDVFPTLDAAGGPIPGSFVAFSIETSSFPEFAGNLSDPNDFSNNLLDNLGFYQGTKPFVRVGGNTQ